MKFTLNKKIFNILGLVAFVFLWQLLSLHVGENSFIFPSPLVTFKKAIEILKDAYVYKCLAQTMQRMFLGFIGAFVLALLFGVVAGNNEKIEELFKPTMTVLKSVPTASLVYLFLVLVGSRQTPLFIVILISFPILYESVVGGVKATPNILLEACDIDGTSSIQKILYIRLPLSIPYIIVGIVSTFSLSLKIEIMAEVITGYTRLGLGSAILAAQKSDPTDLTTVFGYSIIAILIMLVFDYVLAYIKKKYTDF